MKGRLETAEQTASSWSRERQQTQWVGQGGGQQLLINGPTSPVGDVEKVNTELRGWREEERRGERNHFEVWSVNDSHIEVTWRWLAETKLIIRFHF